MAELPTSPHPLLSRTFSLFSLLLLYVICSAYTTPSLQTTQTTPIETRSNVTSTSAITSHTPFHSPRYHLYSQSPFSHSDLQNHFFSYEPSSPFQHPDPVFPVFHGEISQHPQSPYPPTRSCSDLWHQTRELTYPWWWMKVLAIQSSGYSTNPLLVSTLILLYFNKFLFDILVPLSSDYTNLISENNLDGAFLSSVPHPLTSKCIYSGVLKFPNNLVNARFTINNLVNARFATNNLVYARYTTKRTSVASSLNLADSKSKRGCPATKTTNNDTKGKGTTSSKGKKRTLAGSSSKPVGSPKAKRGRPTSSKMLLLLA